MKFIAVIIAGLLLVPAQIAWNWFLPHPDVPLGRPRALVLDLPHWFHVVDPPGFVIGYGEWLQNPLWVSWEVPASELHPLLKRPGHFTCAEGTLVQVCSDDYRGSGFDRGHLAPNYAMSRLYGRSAQVASFSMANITPQKHAMNTRAWQRLEETEMDQLRPQGSQRFWVMAGPLFDARPPRLASEVAVPDAMWRIWVRENTEPGTALQARWQVLAFIVPQTATGFEDLHQFLSSVDSIEAQSGFDFLHQLPDSVEEEIESGIHVQPWQLGGAWTAAPRY